jgi:SAM-dependent methyltransferase
MSLSDQDRIATIDRYRSQYRKYGYSPKSLGWDKGKQDVRFKILTDCFDCCNKSILDIGCGFGDLNRVLQLRCGTNYKYLGVDLVDEFIQEGRSRYHSDNVKFIIGNFIDEEFTQEFDIVISSGIFNHKFKDTNNYQFIDYVVEKSMCLAIEGVAFDFLSDKVDYQLDHAFHSSPEKILSIAYKHTRNVVLRNDYFPFEFSLCLMRDDSFSAEDTIFHKWKASQENLP